MEIAAQLEARGARLDLEWAPRTWNTEADALSNLELGGFDPEKRVVIDVAGGSWPVMAEMIRVGQEFYVETLELKKARKLEGGASFRRQVRKRAGERLRDREPW